MQGKGLIRFFLVFMIVIAFWQLFLNFQTGRVESTAQRYAAELAGNIEDEAFKNFEIKRLKQAYLDSISTETVLNLGVIKYSYEELKRQQLALGLDLKGGMSVVMQVDLKDLIVVLADGNDKDPDFQKALQLATKNQAASTTNYVSLFRAAFEQVAPKRKLSEFFYTSSTLKDKINLSSSNVEVESAIREQANETVDLTFTRLKQRIDKFGVTQPNVSLDQNTDRIIVELPGIENPERARRFLQASAVLEFWDIYEIQNVADGLQRADEYFKKAKETPSTDITEDSTQIQGDSAQIQGDSAQVKKDSSTTATKDSTQTTNSLAGPLFSILDVNRGQYDQTLIGMANKNDRKRIMAMLQQAQKANFFPKDLRFYWSSKPYKNSNTGEMTQDYELYAIKTNNKPAPLEGDEVAEASPQLDQQTSQVAVSLTFKRDGARAWGELTEKAFPTRKSIAIVLDNEVVSAPHVQAVMKDGRSQITGNFTAQEAQDLANILQVGKLPARTEIIEEAIVGPSLGKDNINRSLTSLAVGLLIVLAFMIIYYGGAGIISIAALLFNLIFIYASLSSLGTVLTLPGIAGIVLTMGMAVDANVIIFERIREELRVGKTLLAAIRDGFAHSYSAIVDANVTTILTAFILFYFGLGPIKGFAAVLMIGVLTSLFTAVLVGRLLLDWWTGKDRNITFSLPFSQNAFADINFDFIGKRKIAYIVSGSIILIGLISMVARGFELGVDFKGGYSYAVKFEEPVSRDKVRQVMAEKFGAAPAVKTFGDANTLEITTSYLIKSTDEDADEQVLEKLYEGIVQLTGKDEGIAQFAGSDTTGVRSATYLTRSIKVGPSIADDITQSSFYAAIFALLFIFLYIMIRFRKWQYSAGAVIALFHDVLIVLGIFSIFHGIIPFSLEVDQAFIAAILTVIGYSINDTVIVFDRVREYINSYSAGSKKELINNAINNTLSRTTITSFTTLFVVLVLFLFGGSSITGFAFAISTGIIVGTYSSIFVATPVFYDLTGDMNPKTIQKKKGKYATKDTTETK